MILRTGEDILIWRKRLCIALCGGIVLEEDLDLSSDRILNGWMYDSTKREKFFQDGSDRRLLKLASGSWRQIRQVGNHTWLKNFPLCPQRVYSPVKFVQVITFFHQFTADRSCTVRAWICLIFKTKLYEAVSHYLVHICSFGREPTIWVSWARVG